MSNVTNVILVLSSAEMKSAIAIPNNLNNVNSIAGSPKHLETEVFIGTYNNWGAPDILEEFAELYDSLSYPEEFQLMLKGQEDDRFTVYTNPSDKF